MIEFYNSIAAWFSANVQTITAFLTSSTFFSIVVAVVTFIKKSKSTENNTLSIKSLTEALGNVTNNREDISQILTALTDAAGKVQSIIQNVSDMQSKLTDFQTSTNYKINAMLEVQNIVYSTIKDESIRNAVNSILITAKHEDAMTKSALEAEIAELKASIAEKLIAVDKEVNTTVNKVSNMITGNAAGAVTDAEKEEFVTETVRY